MEQNNQRQAKIIIHPASIDMLANATWDFAKRFLWSQYEFGEHEIFLIQYYIKEFYEDIPPEDFQAQCYSRFEEYCIRIIAAKDNYWSEYSPPHPCVWFNKFNPDGFSKPSATHRKEMIDNFKQQCATYREMLKDPVRREIFRHDDFFKPIRPTFHGYRI